jgi:hypothetical protein
MTTEPKETAQKQNNQSHAYAGSVRRTMWLSSWTCRVFQSTDSPFRETDEFGT